MGKDKYIAALEISSSKVIGGVGVIGKSGQLEIIAVEQEKYADIVRYGQIQNMEETSNFCNFVLERLERRPGISPREITGVYVGLSGRSVRSIRTDVTLSLPDDTEITEGIVDRLRSKALDTDIDTSLEIVEAVPRGFKVGKQESDRPIGMMGNQISATYDLIVARPVMRSNLRRVIKDKLGLEVKGIVVTPLAVGHLVLSEQERKLGCMLVDMGSETSTVIIYTRGNLVYYATIPMGGRNITKDLMSLNELEDKAEELKVNFGNAVANTPSQEKIGRHTQTQISDLVVARAEEIAANIVEQVRFAKLTEKDIPEGIVLCGGGSRLNGMSDLIGKFSGLKVRRATLPSHVRMNDAVGHGMENLELAAIMYAGSEKATEDDECLQMPLPDEPAVQEGTDSAASSDSERPSKPAPDDDGKKGGFFGRIGRTLGAMFTPIGDDDEGDLLN